MLHILLMVLKIIGIVLLILLCVLLALVCAVFFIPVRYVVKADMKSGVEGKITWFLQIFSFRFWYRDGELDWKLRPRLPKKREKVSEVKESEEKRTSTEYTEEKFTSEETTTTTQKRTRKKPTYTTQKICDKIKHIIQTKERIVEFITDEVHVAAFGRIKVEVGKRIKHFRPKVVKGYIRYGCEDPYDTGRILAALSVLYPFYGNEIQIYPEFEQVILEGDVLVKGYIRGIHAGILVWNLFFDENIRKTYQEIRRN